MDINDAWKSTCKTILGDEIGDLEGYRKYLLKYIDPVLEKESAISGKKVIVANEKFSPDAKFISNDEMGQYNKSVIGLARLDINEIKDLDSILESLGEKLYYCGNVVLGNSSHVEKSTGCWDSSGIYECNRVWHGSKYVAFTNKVRSCEYTFGSTDGGELKFVIKGYAAYRNTRCFEALRSKPASDCYYISNLQGCANCMFSFNLRSVNFAIGNLVLPKGEYLKLKEKLVEDIRQTLMDRKEVPTIIDILAGCTVEKGAGALPMGGIPDSWQEYNTASVPNGFALVESAFQNAASLVLGRKLKGLKDYGKWLEEYDIGTITAKSAVGGEPIYAPAFPFYRPLAKNFVKLNESLALGRSMHAPREKLAALRLENAPEIVGELGYVSPEIVFGRSMNVIDCGDYQNAVNVYRGSFVFDSKNSAYCYFPKLCEDVYGCYFLLQCKYCIRCRNSTNLTRCFEVTDSDNCTDCYFCHNCENVSDSMLCFNAKGLRYAIGNAVVGREQYLKAKKLVLDGIGKTLEKDRRLGLNIYNVCCHKPKAD